MFEDSPTISARSTALAATVATNCSAGKDGNKPKRTNWSAGDARIKMEQASIDWENKTGDCHKDMSFKAFAKMTGIPRATLLMHVHWDPQKRLGINSSAGRPSVLKPKAQQFVVDFIRRRDRGNDGLTYRAAVDLVLEVAPLLSRKQAENTLRRTILRKMGVPDCTLEPPKLDERLVASKAESRQLSLTRGLDSFQLVPKDDGGRPLLSGRALLDHLVLYAQTHTPARTHLAPSSYLDVAMPKDQQIIVDSTAEDLTRERTSHDAHGEGIFRIFRIVKLP
jgi:hypothetical protein